MAVFIQLLLVFVQSLHVSDALWVCAHDRWSSSAQRLAVACMHSSIRFGLLAYAHPPGICLLLVYIFAFFVSPCTYTQGMLEIDIRIAASPLRTASL